MGLLSIFKVNSKVSSLYHNLVANTHSRELLKGGSIAFLYRIVNMVLGYVLLLVIARSLGKEAVGSYHLVLAWGSLLALLGAMGLNTSVVRFVAQYHAKRQHLAVAKLYRSVLRLTIPLGLLLGGVIFLLAPTLAVSIYEDASLALHFQLIAVSIPFLVIALLNVEFIRGWKIISWSEFFRNLSVTLIVLIGTLIGLQFFKADYLPVLFYAIGTMLAAVVTTWFIVRRLQANSQDVALARASSPFSFKKHLQVSVPMILTSFIQLLNGRIDIIMLGWFHPTALVGVFGVAFKVSVISDFVISALKTIAMPKISELYWAGDTDDLRKMLRVSTRLIFFSGIPVALVLLIFPETILSWIGDGYEAGATTLRIFAIAQFISASAGLVGAFMNMTGNQKIFTRMVGVATLVNIALNLLLIPTYGMEGAAIGTLVSTIIWNVGGAVWIWRKHRIATFYQPHLPKSPGGYES